MGKKPVLFFAGVAIALTSAFVISNARADIMVARICALTVRLVSSPCSAQEVTRHIREGFHAEWKSGSAEMAGESLKLCWVVTQDDTLLILNETGTADIMPLEAFTVSQAI